MGERFLLRYSLSVQALFLSAGVSLGLSLLGKVLADRYLTERIAVIGEFAGLQYAKNPGIAFGIRLGGGFQTVVIVIALCFVAYLAFKAKGSRLSQAGYGFILGGALMNLLDRLPDGFVTDFFQVGGFPIFNVADSCITVGAVLLLAESFFSVRNTDNL